MIYCPVSFCPLSFIHCPFCPAVIFSVTSCQTSVLSSCIFSSIEFCGSSLLSKCSFSNAILFIVYFPAFCSHYRPVLNLQFVPCNSVTFDPVEFCRIVFVVFYLGVIIYRAISSSMWHFSLLSYVNLSSDILFNDNVAV